MPRTETGKAEAARHYFVHFGNTDSGCICGLAWPCPRVEAIDAIEAEAVTAAIGPFLRRTGGLVVRSEDGKEYLRVPSEWIDDLAAIAKAYREDTDHE